MARTAAILVVFVLVAYGARADGDGVRCTNGAFQHDCPNTAPVCCFSHDGSPAGCCGVGYECNSKGGCKLAPPLPSNESAAGETDVQEDVHTTVTRIIEAAAVLLAVLVFVFTLVFLLLTCKRMASERRTRQALLEAQSSSSESDSEVTSDVERDYDQQLRTKHAESAASGEAESRLARCIKCRAEGVNCLFFPCEHAVVCTECAAHLKRCPECKAIVHKRKKLFVVSS